MDRISRVLILLAILAVGVCAQDVDDDANWADRPTHQELSENLEAKSGRIDPLHLQKSMGKRPWVNTQRQSDQQDDHQGFWNKFKEMPAGEKPIERNEIAVQPEPAKEPPVQMDRGEAEKPSSKKRNAVEPVEEQEDSRKRETRRKPNLRELLDAKDISWDEFKQMERGDRKQMIKEARQIADKRQEKPNRLKNIKNGKKQMKEQGIKGGKGRRRLTGLPDIPNPGRPLSGLPDDNREQDIRRPNELPDNQKQDRRRPSGLPDDTEEEGRRRLSGLPDDIREQIQAIRRDKSLNYMDKRLRIQQLLKESQ